VLSTLVALALALLAFQGVTHVWPIYLLAALGSAVERVRSAGAPGARADAGAARAPAERHQPQHDHVSDRGGARPSLGGVLIAASGVGWAYVANAVSFLFVAAALVMMKGVSGGR
jgi:hypothetical protein